MDGSSWQGRVPAAEIIMIVWLQKNSEWVIELLAIQWRVDEWAYGGDWQKAEGIEMLHTIRWCSDFSNELYCSRSRAKCSNYLITRKQHKILWNTISVAQVESQLLSFQWQQSKDANLEKHRLYIVGWSTFALPWQPSGIPHTYSWSKRGETMLLWELLQKETIDYVIWNVMYILKRLMVKWFWWETNIWDPLTHTYNKSLLNKEFVVFCTMWVTRTCEKK